MSSAVDVVHRLYRHRRWVNRKLLEAAALLDEEQLHREFEMGQGTVWRTLTHHWAAELLWLATLEGDLHARAPGDDPMKAPGNQEGEHAAKTVGELTARWAGVVGRYETFIDGLRDADLDEPCTRVTGGGLEMTMSKLDTLLHVFTHAQYHTAQLVNMLRQLGVADLPETTLRKFAGER